MVITWSLSPMVIFILLLLSTRVMAHPGRGPGVQINACDWPPVALTATLTSHCTRHTAHCTGRTNWLCTQHSVISIQAHFLPPNSSYCALFITEFTVVFVSTVVFMLSLHVCIHICIQTHSVSTLQLNPMLTSSTTDLLHIEFPICIYSHWTHLQDTRECFHKLGSVLLEESRFGRS